MKKLIYYTLIFATIISCFGCYTQKKAVQQIAHAHLVYPQLIADNCAVLFPIKEKTTYLPGKPVYLPGKPVIIPGKRVPCPPVVNQKGDTVTVYADCPPSTIIRDTIVIHDTIQIIQENTALVASKELQIQALRADLTKYKALYEDASHKALIRFWVIIGICVLGVGFIILKVKKIIP